MEFLNSLIGWCKGLRTQLYFAFPIPLLSALPYIYKLHKTQLFYVASVYVDLCPFHFHCLSILIFGISILLPIEHSSFPLGYMCWGILPVVSLKTPFPPLEISRLAITSALSRYHFIVFHCPCWVVLLSSHWELNKNFSFFGFQQFDYGVSRFR